MNALCLATVLVVVVASAAPNIVELAKSVDDLSTLVKAVVAGDLVDTLSSPGPFTVFAPTNEAFAALPYNSVEGLLKPENKDVLVDILKNHVLPEQVLLKDFNSGGIKYKKTESGHDLSLSDFGSFARVCAVSDDGLRCNYVKKADNLASNGVVHTIDGVLVPGTTPLPNMLAKANIVEFAKSRRDLSTFVTAVVAGDLVDTLSSPGLFTVFAPTNEAFAALPAGTLASLLKPENKAELVDILTYHVLPKQVYSSDVQKSSTGNFGITNTVEGKPLRLLSSGGDVMVGPNSEEMKSVTSADNFAANGIIHIIDGLLLPTAVANNKTIRLTSFKGGCSGEEEGSYDVEDGVCRQLSKMPKSAESRDQRIICEPNGDAYILNYGSRDGSCSSPPFYNFPEYLKKNQCLDGSIKVDCNPAAPQNIVQLAQADPDLSTLVTALTAGGLTGTLSGTGPFTVFAPTNEAFAKIDTKALNALLKNKVELDRVLEYHVLAANLHMKELMSVKIAKTIEGENVNVSDAGGVIKVNSAQVLKADVGASNGVVHVIDTLLMPPSLPPLPSKMDIVHVAESNADLSTLVTALSAGKLVATLEGKGPFTVFAPTNEAFAKIPKAKLVQLLGDQKLLDQLLEYHVLSGDFSMRDLMATKLISTLEKEEVIIRSMSGAIMVNNAEVVTADVKATNGVVHVVDKVLVPPDFPLALYPEDIVELSESQPTLSTLVQALVAGKLTATLSGKGPYTVFAPTNNAFGKIPAADLQKLLANPTELDKVLEYHVLSGKFSMRDLMSVRSAKTLEGDNVKVGGSGNVINVNDAKVLKADVEATNGVVHVIDTVLMPPKAPSPRADVIV